MSQHLQFIGNLLSSQWYSVLLLFQFLRQETESLWSEFANQHSQCCQVSGNSSLEQEKLELQDQWRSQQTNLQRRGSTLAAALRQIDSTENHMVDFTDRLDRYLRQPKDITAFTLANGNILKDIKVSHRYLRTLGGSCSCMQRESNFLYANKYYKHGT